MKQLILIALRRGVLVFTPLLFAIAFSSPVTAQQTGYLGIGFEPLGSARAQATGLEEETLPILVEVVDGSPAAEVGLQPGDVLLSLDGQPVAAQHLSSVISRLRPGTTIQIEVWRDGFVAVRTTEIAGRSAPAIQPTPESDSPLPREHRDERPATPARQVSSSMDRFLLFGVYTWEDADGDHELEGLFLRGFHSDLDPHGFVFSFNLDLPLFAMADDDRGSIFDSAVSLGYGTRLGDDLVLYGSGGLAFVMFTAPEGSGIDDEHELSLLYEIGALWSPTDDFGLEGAIRFEPNDLIDDTTWRIGAHLHWFYAAFHGRMDAGRARFDIGFRGSM